MTRPRGAIAVAAGIAAALAFGAGAAKAQESGSAIEVAVVADIPYGRTHVYNFRKATEAIQAGAYSFVVHLGDYKPGDTLCDAVARGMHVEWMAEFGEKPVYYTPGDNDWADCDRDVTGGPTSELTELADLRAAAFAAPHQGEAGFATERQAEYPENALWSHGGAVFATLHVIGTNNGRAEVLLDDEAEALAGVVARDAANLAWLDRAFARAEEEGAAAVVVFQQADPDKGWGEGACADHQAGDCDALAATTAALKTHAAAFAGPSLLVHGDTSPYCMERGFGGDEAPRLWRFNTAGDFVLIDAAKLIIDLENAETPFRVESVLHRIPPAEGC